ncbi:hypothetical protein BJ944DRAFT_241040 [Cunninghamella echinulata]|nr:hypothetical protein BJ944DRAFT_241040 [Cunninghamella echinulata]
MKNIIFILVFIFYIIQTSCQSAIESRGWTGCSLLNMQLYCFGGFIVNATNSYLSSTNEHIVLDLSLFKNFTTFNKKDIQWLHVSNEINSDETLQPRGVISSVPIYSEKSYFIYGGLTEQSLQFPPPPPSSMLAPFTKYNVDTDTWEVLELDNESDYTPLSTAINLGNDTIWMWGGKINSTLYFTYNIVNMYDYKSVSIDMANSWSKPVYYNGPARSYFTATLSHDGFIYIMGGYHQSETGDITFSNFRNVLRFNTNTFSWSTIKATGNIPSNRIYHSTTEIVNKNLLLIYGGFDAVSDYPSNDTSYIYDTIKHTFISIEIPSSLPNTRYGHHATVYDSSYLIFNFGYISPNTPADSLNVLNVKDPYHPTWLVPNDTTTINNDDNTNNDDDDANHARLKMNSALVAAIVVPIVVVLVLCILGSVYYTLYKARKPEKAPIVYKELQVELGENRKSILMNGNENNIINDSNEKVKLDPQSSQSNQEL